VTRSTGLRTALVALPIALLVVIGGAAYGATRTTPAAPAATAVASASRHVPTPAEAAGTVTAAKPGTALAVLSTLKVKGRAPMTGYVRTGKFGSAWLDVDRNGCDTRDDILRRDLDHVTGTRCTVLSGVLHDPYTRATIRFTRGATTSTAVQIDHLVPLGDAWRTGAQQWTQAKRIALANDPINLFAVDGPANSQKSDSDAASWLPKNKSFRCTYIAHQVGVKKAYGLWVTAAEKAAMHRVLTSCPTMRAPVSTLSRIVYSGPGATPSSSATARPSASSAAAVVHAGSYCSSAGATGRTAAGSVMTCRTTSTDSRLRWRSPA
jgi:hypothetical protein